MLINKPGSNQLSANYYKENLRVIDNHLSLLLYSCLITDTKYKTVDN